MLSFRKGGYSHTELAIMYTCLVDASTKLECQSDCSTCMNRYPCADLTRCAEYIARLMQEPDTHGKDISKIYPTSTDK